MKRASTDPTLRATVVAFLVVLLTPAGAWAGFKTCLTGTDPSVAGDASRLAAARSVIGGFGCDCSSYDGSPGKSRADYLRCVRKDIDVVVRYGYLRSQCRGTLLKSLKNATCGWDPSLSVVPCIKKAASGKVSCAIKPSTTCVDVPGQFTQVACTASVFPSCADVADTDNDGLISAGDTGGCAPLPVCGNGVRESAEECDIPGAGCYCRYIVHQLRLCHAHSDTDRHATARRHQHADQYAAAQRVDDADSHQRHRLLRQRDGCGDVRRLVHRQLGSLPLPTAERHVDALRALWLPVSRRVPWLLFAGDSASHPDADSVHWIPGHRSRDDSRLQHRTGVGEEGSERWTA